MKLTSIDFSPQVASRLINTQVRYNIYYIRTSSCRWVRSWEVAEFNRLAVRSWEIPQNRDSHGEIVRVERLAKPNAIFNTSHFVLSSTNVFVPMTVKASKKSFKQRGLQLNTITNNVEQNRYKLRFLDHFPIRSGLDHLAVCSPLSILNQLYYYE